MITTGAFEAKTHFSQLLTKVMNGETVIITKHGQEVAQIIPIVITKNKDNHTEQAIRNIRRLRKGTTLGKNLSVKILKEEGRQ